MNDPALIDNSSFSSKGHTTIVLASTTIPDIPVGLQRRPDRVRFAET